MQVGDIIVISSSQTNGPAASGDKEFIRCISGGELLYFLDNIPLEDHQTYFAAFAFIQSTAEEVVIECSHSYSSSLQIIKISK